MKRVDKRIIELVATIKGAAQELESLLSAPQEVAAPEQVELVPITLQEVRTRLAELSRDGKREAVKALINKYGAAKLTEIDPKYYAALMDEAVVIARDRS